MTGRRGGPADRLVRLYPRDFRARHAAELSATLDDLRRDGRGRLRASVYADLLRGAAGEWLRLLLGARPATILSVLIAAPFLLVLTMFVLNYQPGFVAGLVGPDGTPSLLARVVMICWLLSLPLAVLINAWPRLTATRTRPSFVPSASQLAIGLAVVALPVALMAGQVLRELRQLSDALGVAPLLGQVVGVLVLSLPSMALLLNRAPVLGVARLGPAQSATLAGANLIVGAALVMATAMLAGSLAAEAASCAIVGPNCD